jgi:hypothetical protein
MILLDLSPADFRQFLTVLADRRIGQPVLFEYGTGCEWQPSNQTLQCPVVTIRCYPWSAGITQNSVCSRFEFGYLSPVFELFFFYSFSVSMIRRRISEAQRWQILGMHTQQGCPSKLLDVRWTTTIQ